MKTISIGPGNQTVERTGFCYAALRNPWRAHLIVIVRDESLAAGEKEMFGALKYVIRKSRKR